MAASMNTTARMALLFSLMMTARASAQCGQSGPTAPSAVARTMVGLITDNNNNPLEHVEVILSQPRRKVTTNSQGQFTIADLDPGSYPITVRRIGYEPGTAVVDVTSNGANPRICIDVEPEPLAPLVTSVPRGGLAGTVGDASYAMLPGAQVGAIGGGRTAITDSAGNFFLDLKPGTYGLQVGKKGYGTRFVSVTIPKDSGRKVTIWLMPTTPGQQRRQAYGHDSLRWRLLEKGTFHNLFSAEDLSKTSMDVAQVVANRVVAPPNDNCEAIVDGEYPLPLWAIDKSEIELMEVYPHSMHSPRGVTSMRAGSSSPIKAQQTRQSACSAEIFVWLKK
jgi:hypothetical protein